jgi:hypothetical protein
VALLLLLVVTAMMRADPPLNLFSSIMAAGRTRRLKRSQWQTVGGMLLTT